MDEFFRYSLKPVVSRISIQTARWRSEGWGVHV